MEYMINQLSENDISKYRERSVRALNGIRSLLETPSIISKNGTIVGKYLTIARYMGIPAKPGQASVYNYFTPINTDAIILIRFSDHNNTNAELYNLHEKNGRPNARYIICFSQGEIEPMNEFWNESQHVVIPYDVDAIDNEDSIAKLLNSLVTLLHDGETTFPTLPYFQNSEHVPAQDVLAQVNKDLEKITTENIDRKMSKKNTIRLTESDLKRVISESVKKVLKEEYTTDSNIDDFKSRAYRLSENYIRNMHQLLKEHEDILPQGLIGETHNVIFAVKDFKENFEYEVQSKAYGNPIDKTRVKY